MQDHTDQHRDILNADAVHTACIIDKNGNEQPITREMIQHSCDKLTSSSNEAHKHS